jgi:hypothetical protein
LPDAVRYDVDGLAAAFGDPGGAGTLEFFIDGCVHSFLSVFDCTPTVASYIEIVGSIPELGLPRQQLLVGGFTSAGFNNAGIDAPAVGGSGTDTKSVNLLLALGLDSAATWTFTVNLGGLGGSPRVTNTSAETPPPAPMPEPAAFLLLGTGSLCLARRRRRADRGTLPAGR